jgi:lipopolysaccharide export system ATP-binding protein
MTHKLEVDSIQLDFGLRRVLSDIYFKCEIGSITGLLGRNGQGKTCLMNIVYGSLKAPGKSIRFDNTPVYEAFKRSDLLTFLPQFNFIPGFLSLKRVFADFDIAYKDFADLFPEFKNMEKTRIRNLAGGQKRLAEVYLIIRSPSQFSMLDEPFTHLTPLQVEKVKQLLIKVKSNKGFLITDHLYQQITAVCDDLYVLTDGRMNLVKSMEDIWRLGYTRI